MRLILYRNGGFHPPSSGVKAAQLFRCLSREITHAYLRSPAYHTIPNSGPNGIVVNRDMLMGQFRSFRRALSLSTLVDEIHVMAELPHIDALRTADSMVSIGSSFVSMPTVGLEHRIPEFQETLRYIRASGGNTSTTTHMQDYESCRCCAGDFVMLPCGLALAHGSRTNMLAQQTIKNQFALRDMTNFEVITIEQESDAPALGDYFGFAGENTLLAWKDEHGLFAADQYKRARPDEESEIVYLDPGCHFLSVYSKERKFDVLIQKGYENSQKALAEAGLNPIPIHWSELDKLGVSMRSCVLLLNFMRSHITPRLGAHVTSSSRIDIDTSRKGINLWGKRVNIFNRQVGAKSSASQHSKYDQPI
mmetsp:Transcript_35399/g.55238  ORF Transcript_35399/g.55238 Transcript_35399/m.55238 type:complete len:363 (-) Transcript_35399:170-1258(-)